MSDYIMNANSLKRFTLLFADSLSKGLSFPKRKFVRDMVLGILAAKSVQLASISRSLQESIDLKKCSYAQITSAKSRFFLFRGWRGRAQKMADWYKIAKKGTNPGVTH